MKRKLVATLFAAATAVSAFAVNAGAEEAVKTGLALITDVSDSTDAAEDKEGVGASNVSIAAVTVDSEGKIVNCVIDIAQTKIKFDAEGKVTADLEAEYKSKQELKEEYGMKAASQIEKEWYEQANAFAEYCIGKTAEEVAGLAVTDDGRAGDVDLAASCSIHVAPLQAMVIKAVENAEDLGADAEDKLGIGVDISVANSADATEEKDGLTEAYDTVVAVTVDADGVITSAALDAVQARVGFDAAGVITTDLEAEQQSKQELKDAYGMIAASKIGKEWYEQAKAYTDYIVGKTAEEVEGIAVEEGRPAEEDLAASVTIHINGFNALVAEAVENAR
ncbi:MAG: hypothetical protein Q4B57_04805 [Eubacteriales bacterium]|nr:hypothetical protein [Eubacteriales bacterium]